jgi:selenide, water dikinase
MAAASGVSAQVWVDLVPILPAARTYVKKKIVHGGSYVNLRFLANWVTYDPEITRDDQLLLCDAQTSGGLLAALSGDRVAQVVHELHSAGAGTTALIGCIDAGIPGRIHVVRTPSSR